MPDSAGLAARRGGWPLSGVCFNRAGGVRPVGLGEGCVLGEAASQQGGQQEGGDQPQVAVGGQLGRQLTRVAGKRRATQPD